MKATRILTAKNPNPGKIDALREQARRLGQVRSEVWQRFGSVGGVGVSDRQIRDHQRIAIPLNTTVEPTGTLRLIIKDDERIEIHTTIGSAPIHRMMTRSHAPASLPLS